MRFLQLLFGGSKKLFETFKPSRSRRLRVTRRRMRYAERRGLEVAKGILLRENIIF